MNPIKREELLEELHRDFPEDVLPSPGTPETEPQQEEQKFIEFYTETPNGKRYDYAPLRKLPGVNIGPVESPDRRPDYFIGLIDERGRQAVERGRRIESVNGG